MLLLLFCVTVQTCVAQEDPDVGGIVGYKGMSMKGNWRPYNNNSPWNQIIPTGVGNHEENNDIIGGMTGKTIRLGNTYCPTMHVVGGQASKFQYHSSTNIYRFTHFPPAGCWNPDAEGNNGNGDDITDAPWPFIPGVTYAENTEDGRMIIIDKSAGNKYTAYEISHGTSTANLVGGYVQCSTFNIWNLGFRGYVYYRPPCSAGSPSGSGTGNSCASCDDYWPVAGGSGAGTPLLGGLIRPEELDNAVGAVLDPSHPDYNPDVASGDGLIHHALAFVYYFNRCGPPLYPVAYRADGTYPVNDITKPVEGMLFQLMDPDNSIENSVTNTFGKVIIRTLKKYGMYLVDGGSTPDTLAIYRQNMYTPGGETNAAWWERKYPGMYNSITSVSAGNFRVVDTVSWYGSRLLEEHSECLPH
jgi:hypothetical protein